MTPSIWVSEIEFSGGSTIKCKPDDVVVIVGSNNVGKSVTLREIIVGLKYTKVPGKVVASVTHDVKGEPIDAKAFLIGLGRPAGRYDGDKTLSAFGQKYDLSEVEKIWENGRTGMGDITNIFCRLLSAGDRLNITRAAKNIAVLKDPLEHPAHWMIQDVTLEHEISTQFRKAFGADLLLHRAAGDKLPIYVGPRPKVEPGEDRLDPNYIRKIEALQLLEDQGDGMRSLAGVLLYLNTGKESVLLIDEPEAFLHPPQARFLGQLLSQERGKGKQLFIATHSGDILRGILENKDSKVRIIRLERRDNLNYAHELAPEDISELWSDSLLRSSNILDGLFHEKVIICESDSDAKFYSVIADNIIDAFGPDMRKPDIMFTHCGGKAKIPTIVKALRAVGVPTAVISDFDVLNDKYPLKTIFEASQGDWKEVEGDWKTIKNAVDGKRAIITMPQLKASLIELANSIVDLSSMSKANKEIGEKFRQASPWDMAKASGSSVIPNGDPTLAYTRLINNLKEKEIFVVEIGELEGFVKSAAGHGPKWVNNALEKDVSNDSEFDAAKKFVSQVVNVPGQQHFAVADDAKAGVKADSLNNRSALSKFFKDYILVETKKLAPFLLLCICFIFNFIQEQASSVQSPSFISSSTSTATYFYFSLLLLCYIAQQRKKFAIAWLSIFFVVEILSALLNYKFLWEHPIALMSYFINILVQGYALWLLIRRA